MNMKTKVCSKCDINQPIENYYTIISRKQKPYTYSYCKKCHYQMTKPNRERWVKENPKRAAKLFKHANDEYRHRQRGGIYMIVAEEGIYIGSSDSIRYRIGTHQFINSPETTYYFPNAPKYNITAWRVLEYEDDPELRKKKKAQYIKQFNPNLNRRKFKCWLED